MALVGMYHYRKNPCKVGRAYRYAAIASLEGINFFYFTAKRVDFERKIIRGLYYENGEWKEKEFPFPDVIINTVGPITEFQKEIYYKLKKMISFTSYPVGTKLSVYKRIKKGNEFIDYLIPYKLIKKPIDVFEFLKRHPQVIIKPISGHHGKQVVFIRQELDSFIIKESEDTKTLSRIELYNYLIELLKDKKMLIQKYIACTMDTGESFDIRLHLHKDENKKWQNTLIYPKIGFKNKIATNLGQGGKVAVLKTFLMNTYGNEYFDIMKYLEVFAKQFAEHFDNLYKHEFDELGIDVGLDQDKKIWIYEVNWRPGHIFLEAKASMYAMKYAAYLAIKHRGEKNEITVSE